eukprot:7033110-Prymnesium_polylepis.1
MLVAMCGLVARWQDDRSGPRWYLGFGSPWAPTAARSPLMRMLEGTFPSMGLANPTEKSTKLNRRFTGHRRDEHTFASRIGQF